MQTITIEHIATSQAPITDRAMDVALTFGINIDIARDQTILDETHLPIPVPSLQGGVVFITGPSGGGKSTILNRITERCAEQDWHVVRVDDRSLFPEQPVIDLFALSRDEAIRLLARVGLADAFIMLRTPCELSEGQQWRLNMAMAMHLAQRADTGGLIVVDEFCSALDRVTARTLARNARRWINRTRHTLICAAAHDDLLEDLAPDVLVYKGLGAEVDVVRTARIS